MMMQVLLLAVLLVFQNMIIFCNSFSTSFTMTKCYGFLQSSRQFNRPTIALQAKSSGTKSTSGKGFSSKQSVNIDKVTSSEFSTGGDTQTTSKSNEVDLIAPVKEDKLEDAEARNLFQYVSILLCFFLHL